MLFPGSVYFGYNIQEYLFGGLITPPPPSSLALDLLALISYIYFYGNVECNVPGDLVN